jgi:hypothetical protein
MSESPHTAHGLWTDATCTTLPSVAFISHSEFPAVLYFTRLPPNLVLLFVYMEKKGELLFFLFASFVLFSSSFSLLSAPIFGTSLPFAHSF